MPGISACRLWKVLRLCALLTSKTFDSAKSSSSSAEPASSKADSTISVATAASRRFTDLSRTILRVVRDVRGRGGEVGELGEEHGAADLVELLPRVELLGERDQIDRPALFVDREHGAIDRLVRGVVVVVGAQLERDVVERARVEQQRRQHRALGVEIVRGNAAGDARTVAALAAPAPAAGGNAAAVVPRCLGHSPPAPIVYSAAFTVKRS